MGIRASAQRFFHMATTSTPPAGQLALFAKSDDSLWTKRSDGVETAVGGLVGAIPATTQNLANGWSGTVTYQKTGNIVTVWVAGTKASWGVNDVMLAGAIPVGCRPVGNFVTGYSIAAANDNTPRNFWIDGGNGDVKAAAGGTGSSWGVVTYQVPSIERSVAMASGAMSTAFTAWPTVSIGANTTAYIRGGMVTLNLNITHNSLTGNGVTIAQVPAGFWPQGYTYGTLVYASSTNVAYRVHVDPANGQIIAQQDIPAGAITRGEITYPAALSSASLGTLVDTGWVPYTPTWTNFTYSTYFNKYRRVGNTVTVQGAVGLTSGLAGTTTMDLPFPAASGTYVGTGDINLVGRVRGIRSGVAWYPGDLTITQIGTPSRVSIWMPTGSGVQWSTANPGTWASGDRWGYELEYEAAPL